MKRLLSLALSLSLFSLSLLAEQVEDAPILARKKEAERQAAARYVPDEETKKENFAQRIRERLRVQFFLNYADREPPFHWTKLPMNWNAVSHQGVLGAALTIEEDYDLLARMLSQAAVALRVFLSGFDEFFQSAIC